MPLSNESLICRVEWRPSRLLCAALMGLGGLAALSFWLSALPGFITVLLSLVALAYGVWLGRREARREPLELVWPGGDSEISINFAGCRQAWSAPRLYFRGPLVSLLALDAQGRARRLHWWPDTLSSVGRRSLRLAISVRSPMSPLK